MGCILLFSKIIKTQRILSILLVVLSLGMFIYSYFKNIIDTKKQILNEYEVACELIVSGNDYQGGISILNELGDYRESLDYAELANKWLQFEDAESLISDGQYKDALEIFKKLAKDDDFEGAKKASQKVTELNKIIEDSQKIKESYNIALKFYESGDYLNALAYFKESENYENSNSLKKSCETAVKILQNSNVVSAGVVFSVGITEKGRVVSSGDMVLSQSDVEDWEDIVSIATFGALVIGLKMDGTVVTAGKLENDYRIETGNWDDIIAVSAGDLYVIGLRENGTIVAQGYNGDGQMDIDDWTNITAISTGWRHTVGLTSDGKIRIAGFRSKDEDEIRENEEWTDIIAISAGGGKPGVEGEQGHTVGLKSNGEVVAIGDNTYGQCEVSEWKNIIAISAGAFHTVGLTHDGKVVTTQASGESFETISQWKNIVAIAAGYGTTFAVDKNGIVYSAGYDRQHQRDIDDWGVLATHQEEWLSIFDDSKDRFP